MRRIAVVVTLAAALVTGPSAALGLPPLPALPEPPPTVDADAWLVVDAATGIELAGFDAGSRRPMASVTKLMTALVTMDRAGPDEVVVISESAAATGEAEIGLVPGEEWSVRELLAATLVRSGNDAAVALAEHVGGSVEAFAGLMNARALELGMVDTNFVNPHGLDDPEHFTTARDLITLAAAALDDPLIARTVRIHVVKFRSDPQGRSRRAINTNRLLGTYPGVIGMKTGYTGDAGRVLVSAAERNGRLLIAVVMNAEDHFDATRRLLEYAFGTSGYRDSLLRPLAAGQGGGGAVVPGVPLWLRARLGAAPALDPGLWAVTDPRETPAGRALADAVGDVVARLPGTGR